jgi:hypothetical protein
MRSRSTFRMAPRGSPGACQSGTARLLQRVRPVLHEQAKSVAVRLLPIDQLSSCVSFVTPGA